MTELVPETPAQLLVQLDVVGAVILARITRKSAERLSLVVGEVVSHKFKACAAGVISTVTDTNRGQGMAIMEYPVTIGGKP